MQVYSSADGGEILFKEEEEKKRTFSTEQTARTVLSDSRNNDSYETVIFNESKTYNSSSVVR